MFCLANFSPFFLCFVRVFRFSFAGWPSQLVCAILFGAVCAIVLWSDFKRVIPCVGLVDDFLIATKRTAAAAQFRLFNMRVVRWHRSHNQQVSFWPMMSCYVCYPSNNLAINLIKSRNSSRSISRHA